jgi:hypothetical protein
LQQLFQRQIVQTHASFIFLAKKRTLVIKLSQQARFFAPSETAFHQWIGATVHVIGESGMESDE